MKKNTFFLGKTNNILLIIFVIFFSLSIDNVYAINTEKQEEELELTFLKDNNLATKNPKLNNDDYDPDQSSSKRNDAEKESDLILLIDDYDLSKKKHLLIGYKHNSGSFLSKKIRLFYNINSVKTVPCLAFQEWLNWKQFCFGVVEYNIPKIELLFSCLNLFGIKEEFIDDKYERIALESIDFYRLLHKIPSLGYFYFKHQNAKLINSVNIAFCNCQVKGYSVLELIYEIMHLRENNLDKFKQHLVFYVKNLVDIMKSEISLEEMKISVHQLLDQIISADDIEILDQSLIFHLIKNLSRSFRPEVFSFHYSINNKSTKPLKEMNFDVSQRKEHLTIGFALKLEQNDTDKNFFLSLYEIFRDEIIEQEQLRFVDKVLISHMNKQEHYSFFQHLSINILEEKTLFTQAKFLFNKRETLK
ncbi:hypothetical protein [Candidatus Phytoplasma melaleucae]|uniref:Sequence-variable mosaic (SVM) signal sequence domain-containing protein n=1 Tax=Candidatus Phytoplasma melaleucae TaxID=2982630 RepID=A0ABT9DFF1_9MOLU|nr:hypothetical protein ['Melaleuca sp.' phytoplasma]MDO8167950.1 hypothetical protein ['Melaleuca sp.' phytoplasma]